MSVRKAIIGVGFLSVNMKLIIIFDKFDNFSQFLMPVCFQAAGRFSKSASKCAAVAA